jgi:hypothetical protein
MINRTDVIGNISTRWQRSLHFIMEKSTEPQLYLEQIEDLNACHPDWPFALVRLGKAYLLLEDLHRSARNFRESVEPAFTSQGRDICAICRGVFERISRYDIISLTTVSTGMC